MPDASTLGSLIRERRLEKGLSLGQLATKVGHTAASVRRWERGEDMPEVDLLPKIARELDLDAGRLTALREKTTAAPPVAETADDDQEASSEPPEVGESAAALETEAGEPEAAGDASGGDETGATHPAEATKAGESSLAMPWEIEDDSATGESTDPAVDAARPAPPETTDGTRDDDAVETATSPPATGEEPQEVAPAVVSAGATEAAATASMPEVRPADLVDAPTQAVPVVPGPAVPAPPTRAPAAAVTMAPRQEPVRSAIERPGFQNPFKAFFDPDQKWLYWIRAGLLIVVSLVLLYTLIWALGELWDSLGELLDTIGSTEEVSDVQPGVDGTVDSGNSSDT